ncbi:hypothetical protein [Streptomyces sp. RKAG293]|uniref:hypothetical protein n=1 Tax=Streptomyces sp. RKAG293 TaxID=2893403 RepID=UPI0020332353|nr:hypothetical protein [Streptomyces sp. RKAG293]MCM2420282.1 hypothetical protein [Streptomyces sp. RKAG293]
MSAEKSTEQAAEAPKYSAEQIRSATTKEAVLKALLDQVDTAYKVARTEVQAMLDEQQRTTGGTKFDASLPDGTKVGDVRLSSGEAAAKILDERAFVEWAHKTFPSEAVTRLVRPVPARLVKGVQPRFVTLLLERMTAAGKAQVHNEETGEILDVPGVEIKPSRARTHSVNFTRESKVKRAGRELVAEAWRAGILAPIVLPALAPPAAPAAPVDESEAAA